LLLQKASKARSSPKRGCFSKLLKAPKAHECTTSAEATQEVLPELLDELFFFFYSHPRPSPPRAPVAALASSPTAARPHPLPPSGSAAWFLRPGGAATLSPSSSRRRCGHPLQRHRGPTPFLPAVVRPGSSVPVAPRPRPLPPPGGGVASPPSSSRWRRSLNLGPRSSLRHERHRSLLRAHTSPGPSCSLP
jgi:hypothetical protein